MKWRVSAVAFASIAAFAADPRNTVMDVCNIVHEGITRHWNDGQLAKALHKLKLAESLDQHVLEELESQFDGPKTAEELQRLFDDSETLKEATDLPNFPSPAPAPDYAERRHILIEAGRNALSYAASMPDFICSQTVRRYESWNTKSWDLKDTLAIKLSYFDHVENYQLTTVNGHPTRLTYENLRGAITEGEFVSMLVNVFDTHGEFWWDHWTTLRRRSAHVFRFQIKQKDSRYRMEFGMGDLTRQSAVAGQHGFVYVDRETNRILRVIAEADTLPPDFPVQSSRTVLDYDFIDISGRKYLLPLHADARMGTIQVKTRNVMDFSAYRKFAGESTITYDALPTDDSKEKDKPPPVKK